MNRFTEPPMLEQLSREQLIESVRTLVATCNRLSELLDIAETSGRKLVASTEAMMDRLGLATPAKRKGSDGG